MAGLFSFKGRIGRHAYLLVTVPLAFVYLVWIAWWLFATSSFDDEGPAKIFRMSAIGWVVCAWPYLAAGFKRCHDRDKSGLWYVGWTAGCLGFWIAAIMVQPWLAWLGNLIALWTLVEMGFIKGTPGPNRFGPPADEWPPQA
jgi:uncharacterized membrane protein YhaH (DUF805 family)